MDWKSKFSIFIFLKSMGGRHLSDANIEYNIDSKFGYRNLGIGFSLLPFLIAMNCMISCDRDPTVTSWRIDFDNGWWARGIYRGDLKRVSYGSFHWSRGISMEHQDVGSEYGITVDGKYFSVSNLDAKVLSELGFNDTTAPGHLEGHESWSGNFSNGGVNLLYNKDSKDLVVINLIFYQQQSENADLSQGERFSFDAGTGRLISGPVSEEFAAEIFGGTYERKSERYPEW